MIPTVEPLQKHAEEEEHGHHDIRPRPPRPDPMPSLAATHRPETTPFMKSLPHDPIYHRPPWRRFPPTATAATSRQFRYTIDGDGHQPPTMPFRCFPVPPMFLGFPFFPSIMAMMAGCNDYFNDASDRRVRDAVWCVVHLDRVPIADVYNQRGRFRRRKRRR
jgi:hypothetical protein